MPRKTNPALDDPAEPAVAGDAPSRRDQIVRLAAELFARHGIAGTSVRDIGDGIGIQSGSLYRYFDSKDAIVEQIVGHFLAQLLDSYQEVMESAADATSMIHGLAGASFEAIRSHPDACAIYQNDYKYLRSLGWFEELTKATSGIQEHWLTAIDTGIRSGEFRSDIDRRALYYFARDSIWFTVRWYDADGEHSVGDLTEMWTSIFLDGIAR